jgi:hypothetical protein
MKFHERLGGYAPILVGPLAFFVLAFTFIGIEWGRSHTYRLVQRLDREAEHQAALEWTQQCEERQQTERSAANQQRREQLSAEAKKNGFLSSLNAEDARLWSTLISNATLDEACNIFPECVSGSTYMARPIVVRMPDEYRIGLYTVILGMDEWTPGGHRIIPRITYYAGAENGSLWRVEPNSREVQVRNPSTDSWSVLDPNEFNPNRLRHDARSALLAECSNQTMTM